MSYGPEDEDDGYANPAEKMALDYICEDSNTVAYDWEDFTDEE